VTSHFSSSDFSSVQCLQHASRSRFDFDFEFHLSDLFRVYSTHSQSHSVNQPIINDGVSHCHLSWTETRVSGSLLTNSHSHQPHWRPEGWMNQSHTDPVTEWVIQLMLSWDLTLSLLATSIPTAIVILIVIVIVAMSQSMSMAFFTIMSLSHWLSQSLTEWLWFWWQVY